MIMILKKIFLVVILFILFVSTLSKKIPTLNDEVVLIRQRLLELAIWPPPANISDTVENALSYSHTLNSSCYWADVDYTSEAIVSWPTAVHMYRITTMLQAITVNGSTIKNDPKVTENVHCALNVWLTRDFQNPNWWYNQIGIPLEATSQLLMLGENATSTEIEKIVQISFRASWWIHRPTNVGANLVSMLQIQIYRSLSTNNLTGLAEGFNHIWGEVGMSLVPGEGLQPDWTYHFHAYQLMSGASYGLLWINNVLLFFQCTFNTTYQPDEKTLITINNYLTKGDSWMIIEDHWDWLVVGREMSSPGNGFKHGLQPDWIRTAAQLTKSNQTKTELINFANRLDQIPGTPLLIGNKHFYASDYQVHRRSNWTFTIKMQSIRTHPSECLNGQNLKDEHGGQGVLNLYRNGFNDYQELFPIIDWGAINGITVQHDIPLENCSGGVFPVKTLSFVGGVSDGIYGLAIMDTASHNLTAQRSWHFYDDAVIALATNLTVNSTSTAWTTLASRLLTNGQISVGFFNSTIITLNDGNYSFTQEKSSPVQWIHLSDSNIGYILPLKQPYEAIGIEVGVKTGNYNEIGPYNMTVTARMTTVYINHGQGPNKLQYNYMILPNVSRESMPTLIEQYNNEKVFSCISTNGLFHGTMWPSLRRASFVLWDNITTRFDCDTDTFSVDIEISDAGAYLYSETDDTFTVTASHPTRINTTLSLTVEQHGEGEGCEIISENHPHTTRMVFTLPSLPEHQGSSVQITCNKCDINT
jgi:chondroitin AC lyase